MRILQSIARRMERERKGARQPKKPLLFSTWAEEAVLYKHGGGRNWQTCAIIFKETESSGCTFSLINMGVIEADLWGGATGHPAMTLPWATFVLLGSLALPTDWIVIIWVYSEFLYVSSSVALYPTCDLGRWVCLVPGEPGLCSSGFGLAQHPHCYWPLLTILKRW